jgi:hypothetical protein
MSQPAPLAQVNNLSVLHAKTSFQDSPIPAERRHLLRLWV